MEFNQIIITFIVGGLVLLSFLKIGNAVKVNRKGNLYFGLFTLLWSTFWLDEMIIPPPLYNDGFIFITVKFLQFLVALVFYLSVRFYTGPGEKFTGKDTCFLIIPLLFLVLLMCKPLIGEDDFMTWYIPLFLGHSLFYTLLAYRRIEKHQNTIELYFSNKEPVNLSWIKYIIYAFIASSVVVIVYTIFMPAGALNVYINLYFLMIVYMVAFYSIRQKEIFPQNPEVNNQIETADFAEISVSGPKHKLMHDADLELLKQALLELMETEQPYLDSELTLMKMAEKMKISSHQLSYVMNSGFGENFFHFVNKYRVRKAGELLMNPGFDHLNIVAIGFDSGFNSKTSFNTTFKKITSYTPTEYRKNRSLL